MAKYICRAYSTIHDPALGSFEDGILPEIIFEGLTPVHIGFIPLPTDELED